MTKEDYSKYYIQGSDHYLVPSDIFVELIDEMINWREDAKIQSKENEKLKQSLIDVKKLINENRRWETYFDNEGNMEDEFDGLYQDTVYDILQIIDKFLGDEHD